MIIKHISFISALFLAMLTTTSSQASTRDLAEIQADGVLRHIGIPYANFVTAYPQGNKIIYGGMDTELMQGFAAHLGVKYEYVPAKWTTVFGKLTGRNAQFDNNQINYGEPESIQGDVIANGATTLEWRKQVIDFSDDYFPSAVWLVSRSDSDLQPIQPSGSIAQDIAQVKSLLKDRDVLAMKQSCLDPSLYNMELTGANIILPIKERKLNEMIPAILNNDADSTLLDVPDTLIALEKWPGEIKVIGPISFEQRMAVGFRKESPELRKAFNAYLKQIRANGTYNKIVQKYYPSVFHFYPKFFASSTAVN
ncbi:MAG: membrane-bound lytic murein transglycosylase MltF [Psychromonas sp.]|jgi:membrane-bound lytic murein transglycosylase MltF|uniref:transporter substrate-binding domain-containing protein n=1 Tax=Psychromonas sp. TaxID=1884585 RepID=UPI0039E43D09